jgi:hypothetical protein
MAIYKFTQYFENEVLRKRTYLKREWCIEVIENPIRAEVQKIIESDFGERLTT